MKQLATTIFIVLIFSSLKNDAQTSERKNNFAIGGGKESYNGDLGNAWFKPDEEWYGFVSIRYSRYLNKSFDGMASVTYGDFGHCREKDDKEFRDDGTEVLNMLCRLTSGVVSLKYKFANDYLLKENSKLAPYIYLGGGINNLKKTWGDNRVNKGNYASINGGVGLSYNFAKNFNFTYNLGFGYFTSDDIDYRIEGRSDMYMQHTFLLGMNF